MSKLEELIRKECPNGVEYVPIGSLIKRVNNKAREDKSIKKVYAISNKLGIVDSLEYHDFKVASNDTSNYYIIRKGQFAYNPARLNIGSIAWLDNKEDGLLSPMYVVFKIDESRIMQEFLFLLLGSQRVKNDIVSLTEQGARFRFNFERWNKISIPLPSLEVQKEIINILRTFKEYSKLLETELIVRQQQYEYYRNKLLCFADNAETLGAVHTHTGISMDKK